MHMVRGRYCPATYAYHAWAVRWSDSTVQRWKNGLICFEQTSCLKAADASQPLSWKKFLRFVLPQFFFLLCICPAEHFFLTDTLKSHGHSRYYGKADSRQSFPQEIGPLFLPDIALSIRQQLLTTLSLTTSASILLSWISNHFSRFGLLRYVFIEEGPTKLFFCSVFFFSRCYLSLLPTSDPLGWCYWCFSHRISPYTHGQNHTIGRFMSPIILWCRNCGIITSPWSAYFYYFLQN